MSARCAPCIFSLGIGCMTPPLYAHIPFLKKNVHKNIILTIFFRFTKKFILTKNEKKRITDNHLSILAHELPWPKVNASADSLDTITSTVNFDLSNVFSTQFNRYHLCNPISPERNKYWSQIPQYIPKPHASASKYSKTEPHPWHLNFT